MSTIASNNVVEQVAQSFDKSPTDDQYWQLLDDYILSGASPEDLSPQLDPFAIKSPRDLKTYYFPRGKLEDQVVEDGSQIFLGREYSGKTSTRLWASERLEGEGYLVVPIRLEYALGLVQEKEFYEGIISPLALSVLPRFIFDAFWSKFISAPDEHEKELAVYRKDHSWMEHLRYFYQHYPPLYPTLADSEFEFMCWLESAQGDWQNRPRSPHETLKRLVHFITQEVHSLQGGVRKYKGIVILVDEFDHLQEAAAERVLNDLDQLLDLNLKDLQVKLFIKNGFAKKVYQLDAYRQRDVRVVHLPHWEETDVIKLLLIPPLIYTGRIGDLVPDMGHIDVKLWLSSTEFNWSLRMKPWGEGRRERMRIFTKLVNAALRTNSEDTDYDTPYHALCLTRGLLSVFAGSYAALGLRPVDVTDKTIDALINAYWDCRQGGGYV